MKKLVSAGLAVAVVVLLSGIAFAHGPGMWGGGPMWGGGAWGQMGPGMMWGRGAQWNCPGLAAGGETAAQVSEEKAKELAQAYADSYLKGFTVDKVLPFAGRHGTAYSVELKGPEGQTRTFHVNPWGQVMPFGGPGPRRAG
jgi:hypothetical protein